jgi:hypothetical protein
MLGDHGDISKSKPWEGSAHVPLVWSSNIAQSYCHAVGTIDMSGTFMDYAKENARNDDGFLPITS